MKKYNSILTLALVSGLAFTQISCSESKQTEESTVAVSETTASQASEAVSPSKTVLIDQYLEVKNALAANNSTAAGTAAAKLAKTAEFVTLETNSDEDQTKTQAILTAIQEKSTQMTASDMDQQIESFESMGKDMQNLLAIVGSDRTLYQQHCPMYKNNTGGIWLSESEQISNPLFKGKMPACGSVEGVIEAS